MTILLFLTLIHDLILGSRVAQIIQIPTESRTRLDHTLVVGTLGVARFSLILALAILFAAVVLVRA